MRIDNTDTTQTLPRRLGRSPLPLAIAFWTFGVLWCLGSLRLNRIDDVWGPIAMGMATFVNFFCFVQGLNHLKRAVGRRLTLRKVGRLGLVPSVVRTQGGYVVIDPERGVLVRNGSVADFRGITRIVCRSTWQAHKIEIHGCTRLPIVEGFATREDVLAAADELLAAVRAKGRAPRYDLIDAFRGDAPAASENGGTRTPETAADAAKDQR